jgi:hypothetical protein
MRHLLRRWNRCRFQVLPPPQMDFLTLISVVLPYCQSAELLEFNLTANLHTLPSAEQLVHCRK